MTMREASFMGAKFFVEDVELSTGRKSDFGVDPDLLPDIDLTPIERIEVCDIMIARWQALKARIESEGR